MNLSMTAMNQFTI